MQQYETRWSKTRRGQTNCGGKGRGNLPTAARNGILISLSAEGLFYYNFMQMKKIAAAFLGICTLLFLQSCNPHLQKNSEPAAFTQLSDSDVNYQYIKKYFILSEQRKLELWYSTYLNKCRQFYKIKNPTKNTILNLIKSYWVTSDGQKHDIQSIEWRPIKNGKEVFVTMNYSYRIIAENRMKQIPQLKLQLMLNRRNKVISIKEFSRG